MNAVATAAHGADRDPMDRDFIEKNQIIERYLAGKLPPKGILDFERLCRENPKLLEDLGMAERVQRAVKLLESGAHPELWQEKPKAFWEKPRFIAALAVVALAGAGTAGWLASRLSDATANIGALQKEVIARPIDPATQRRTILVEPSRTGMPRAPMFSIGDTKVELVEMKVDVSWSNNPAFRVAIDRVGEGSIAVLHNVLKDSNGHMRISLNSSALGPGIYQMSIEGLDWRGQATPVAWVSFSAAPRPR
jgi:hypothetical protein